MVSLLTESFLVVSNDFGDPFSNNVLSYTYIKVS